MSAHLAVVSVCRDNGMKETHSLPFPTHTDSSKDISRETGFGVYNDGGLSVHSSTHRYFPPSTEIIGC